MNGSDFLRSLPPGGDIRSVVVRVRELSPVSATDLAPGLSFGELYGTSIPMRRLYAVLKRAARSNADVLIEGESGTGKELIATEIVRRSGRADKPLGEGRGATSAPLSMGSSGPATVDTQLSFKDAKGGVIERFEQFYLTALFAWAGGNVSRAARKANLDRMHMYRLLQRHGIRKSGSLDE